MNKQVIVTGAKSDYSFLFVLHKSDSVSEHKIEAGFYKKSSVAGTPPEGPHFEIEIITDLQAVYPEGRHEHVHIHPSEKFPGRKFVCWTQPVETLEKAIAVMNLWAAGTVYTLENGPSFGERIDLHQGITAMEMDSRRGVFEGYGVVVVVPSKV